jgi:ribonuclease HI
MMDLCTRKRDRRAVWEWTKQAQIEEVTDLLDDRGLVRETILKSAPLIVQCNIRTQIRDWANKFGAEAHVIKKTIRPGCIVTLKGTGWTGRVVKIKKHECRVERLSQRRDGKKCIMMRWRKARCYMTEHPNTEHTLERAQHTHENLQPRQSPSMGKMRICATAWGKIMTQAKDPTSTLMVVSDGSVRDHTRRGTWAWSIVTKGGTHGIQLGKVRSVGKESIQHTDLRTRETFSYRMEAMALLDGLTYLHNTVHWTGKVEWHTDSEAVIKTYNKPNTQAHPGTWERQADKDVWDLLIQIKRAWEGRLDLRHVESHVNTKRDEHGALRTPTPYNG